MGGGLYQNIGNPDGWEVVFIKILATLMDGTWSLLIGNREGCCVGLA
jgi:hypothetical protein